MSSMHRHIGGIRRLDERFLNLNNRHPAGWIGMSDFGGSAPRVDRSALLERLGDNASLGAIAIAEFHSMKFTFGHDGHRAEHLDVADGIEAKALRYAALHQFDDAWHRGFSGSSAFTKLRKSLSPSVDWDPALNPG